MSYRSITVGPVGPLITLFSDLVLSLPTLAVLIVGLVLVSARGRLPARSATLARSGLLLMVLNQALSLIWSVLFPHVVLRRAYTDGGLGIRTIGYLNGGVSFVLGAIFAVGLALLIAGLVTAQRAPDQTAPEEPAYGQPAHVGYTSPYGARATDPSVPFQSGVAGETGRILPDAQDPWSGDSARAQ